MRSYRKSKKRRLLFKFACSSTIAMKKQFLIVSCFLNFAFVTHAQVVFVDTKHVLKQMPEYQNAEKRLDQISVQYQREIDDKQEVLNKMYKDYELEQAMLSDETRKKRQDEVFAKEKEVRELQRMHFGYEGDLYKKRDELEKPLKDKITAAIQKIATSRNYGIVLDKSEGITVMYSVKSLDITDDVIREIKSR